MSRCDLTGKTKTAVRLIPAVLLCLACATPSATAAEAVAAPAPITAPLSLEPPVLFTVALLDLDGSTTGLSGAVLPDGDFDAQAASNAAPAEELATGLGVQVDKKRRKFRTRAVNWMEKQSPALGTMTDFLLGGGEGGWHLAADVTGTEEYVLEWKVKFR
jgi:hypothetical protein